MTKSTSRTKKIRLGVLVSGSGTNLQAIIDAAEGGRIDAQVSVVVSDNGEAHALRRAKDHGIPSWAVARGEFADKASFEQRIVEILKDSKVDLVCLAGFMRIVGHTLLCAFPDRILNIHPALLPSFPGLEAQRQAFDYGIKVTGCTVHFVDEKTDHGPIICQEAVPVMEDDTPETLKARILKKEHAIYPKAIQLFAENRLKIVGRRVYISEGKR
jgi:phosphoribosylglycinamide formyltransferase-1